MSKHTNRRPLADLDGPPNFNGVLSIHQLARLLLTSQTTIERRIRRGAFPIPPLEGFAYPRRWSGPVVRRYLENNGQFRIDVEGS